MRVKNITYKIVNGRWKSKRIAEEHGLYTYPILLTIVEDESGNKVEISLSYTDIVRMLEKHIWLEKILDWDYLRKGDQHKVKETVKESIRKASNTDSKIIRKWFGEVKEK